MEKREPYFDTAEQAYTGQPANYAGQPPSYGAQQPHFVPQQPNYVPQQPSYVPQSPSYVPQQPNYGPQPPAYGGQAPNYIVTQPGYVRPPPSSVVQPSTSCFERNQINKPQSNSVGAAALVFMSGGMSVAYSFTGFSEHMRISWFIGAIIGAVLGAIVVNFLQKKAIYLCSAALVVLSGILFVSLPYNYDAIIAARYIDGIATGLALTPCLLMAGEEAVNTFRGRIAANIEMMSFSLGIYIQLIYMSSWTSSINQGFTIEQMHGALSIIYGIIALLLSFFLVIESPVFFLVRNDEQQAIDSIRRLQMPFIITQQTYDQLEQLKRYIAFNKEMTFGQSANAGLAALLKLCAYRGLVALTFSMVVYVAFVTSTALSVGTIAWPFIIFGTLRWFGVLLSSLLLDTLGRKRLMLCGALVCAGMAIGLGIMYGNYFNYFQEDKMTTTMALLFVFEFFAGIFVSASSAYLTEAFPLAVKPYYIATAFIVEMLVQIIICTCTLDNNSLSDYFYASGVMLCVFFGFGFFAMPETKRKTLLEAQQLFYKPVTTGFD